MTEQTLDQLEAELKEDKKKGKKKLLLLLLLLLFFIVGGIWAAITFWPQPKSQWELDAEALQGFLSTHTAEEIQAELNRIIEKGRFNISINPVLTVQPDGTANLMIENVPANNYWMQVTVVYYDENNEEHELYRSGMIRQGYYIEDASITGEMPPAGEYYGSAVFTAIYPESDEEVGSSVATMVIRVLEGEG